MKQNIIKKILLSCVATVAPLLLLAQAPAAAPSAGPVIDFNWILITIAFILLLPIFILSNTFIYALKEDLKKKANAAKKAGAVIFFLSLSTLSEAKTFNANDLSNSWLSWLLTGVICVETILIVFFSIQTIKLLKPGSEEAEEEEESLQTESWLTKTWNKMNRFKPLTEEGDIDTGHEYDGIRELNNVTPPWFITTFVLSIIIAAVYLIRYHVVKSAPLQIEEFNIEMAAADSAKTKQLAVQGNNIDENTVVMLGASDIDAGKLLFTNSCVACHAAHGGSMTGGVGPNLTDEYWIHGGSIKDIFKTIKYGWPEKGMIAWQNNFSPKQMAQLASFVKSLQGTNPAGAKEPQGELYSETAAAAPAAADSTMK
jgi:cytochrome c oxidase cbb3-type subunit 3